MKYKTLIIILLFFQLWSNDCRSQDIRSGIYSLQKTIDTTLLRQCFKPFDGIKNETELHFKPSYTNLIDSDFLISHAVVVNIKNEYGESVRKIVFLNNSLNDYTKSIRYSDDVARKYVSLNFKVDTAGGNRSWYIEGDNDFYDIYYDLDRYAPSDYYSRTDKDKNYDVNYDRQNFYAAPDFFILKSYRYKLFRDSIYPKTGFGQASDIFYSSEQQAAIFNLEQAIDYVDIVPVQKSVVFYSADDNQKIQIMPGDFLALRAEHDEWYYGDFVTVGGEAVLGKIMIDSLVANGKTTQVYDGKLRLSVFYTTAVANGFDFEDYGVIHSIKIYNADNQLIQVIKNPGLVADETSPVNLMDVNFDGRQDLEIFANDGGAGPNFGNNYYLYNPDTEQFDFSEEMSALSQPEVDAGTQTIYAAWRNGAANHGAEKYKWINGKLTLVEYIETNWIGDGVITEIHKILINGKMETIEKQVKDSEYKAPFIDRK